MRTENMLAFTPFNIFSGSGDSSLLPRAGLRGPGLLQLPSFSDLKNKIQNLNLGEFVLIRMFEDFILIPTKVWIIFMVSHVQGLQHLLMYTSIGMVLLVP